MVKKDKEKNKVKNLSYIKYYTYKQKDHYTNKYLEKPKTSGSLSYFYINDWKKNGGVEIGTLYLIFRDLQRSNRGLIRFKK